MKALRLSARWVLPGEGEPIADGAVLVLPEGRIAAVGADAAVPRPAGCDAVALGDAALMPALVNAHSHLELTGLRGLVRDLPFLDWLRTIRAIKDALDAEAFRASARWGVLEGFAAGIATHGDSGTSGQGAAALAALGARGVAYQEVIGPDPSRAGAVLAAVERALDALGACRSERVSVGISPHAPYTVSDRLLEGAAALAAARGLKVAMHVAESPEERALVTGARGPFADYLRSRGIPVEPRGASTVAWLERAGLLDLRPVLVHCVTADQGDFERARRHGAAVAHCPSSNAALGHGRADLAAMRRAGVTVGLGTDSVAAGGRLDLFAEARLAALGLAGTGSAAEGGGRLSPREMLRLASAGGAAALGLAGVGALAPGAWGDLAAVGLDSPALSAAADVETAVAWGATASDVVLTAVAGRVVYRRGAWPGVDLAAERTALERAAGVAAAARARYLRPEDMARQA